jgi:collagenase-like PrtC family protease
MKKMKKIELVVSIHSRESLAIALDKGVGGVAAQLPVNPDSQVFSELADWRAAAREHKVKFYLIGDWLVRERELAGVPDMLAAVARLDPDALQLRDLGLVREARRSYPDLHLQAAGSFGIHNSPGVQLAASLGFSRVVVAGPVSLKDLALMRRQTAMDLAVALGTGCPGYAGLCLMEEYLGVSCETCGLARPQDAGTLMATLETLSGLCQLGIEAVQLQGELFAPASLGQVIGLCQAVAAAAPMERHRVLAAAREVVEAFGETLRMSPPAPGTPPGPPVYPLPPGQRLVQSPPRPGLLGRGRVWLEVRDYAEAQALAREWREPLVLGLTSETYTAFLKEHRQWNPRRLLWRLPPAIPESALGFYQKALETLRQGGFNRFVAGDWGAVALVGAAGDQIFGDQTLGVRNSWSVAGAREFKVARVCLPPGHRSDHWQEVLAATPFGSFWSYLYRCAALAVCPSDAAALTPPENLRWVVEDGKAFLCLKAPQNLFELDPWFKQQSILPLVVALSHSPRPRGQLPPWLAPSQERPAGK